MPNPLNKKYLLSYCMNDKNNNNIFNTPIKYFHSREEALKFAEENNSKFESKFQDIIYDSYNLGFAITEVKLEEIGSTIYISNY